MTFFKSGVACALIMVLLILFPRHAQGQWHQATGFYGGNVYAFSQGTDTTDLIAGTIAGAFRTTDSGSTWGNVSSGLTNTNISALVLIGKDVFAATAGGSGVYRSIDGDDWTALSVTVQGRYFTCLAVKDSALFAGGDSIFVSTDSGGSWTPFSAGLPGGSVIWSMAIGDTSMFAGTETHGLYRSDNGGTWYQIPGFPSLGATVLSVAIQGAFVYAGIRGDGVYRSTDGGSTWAHAGVGFRHVITGFAFYDGGLFASDAGGGGAGISPGIHFSTDNGQNFSDVSSGLPPNTPVNCLGIVPDGMGGSKLYAGTDGSGVFRWSSGSPHWTAVNHGMTATYIWSIAVSPAVDSEIFAGVHYGGIFRSTDNGASWTSKNSGLGNTDVRALAVTPEGTVFAGTSFEANSKVFRSTDQGESWVEKDSGIASDFTVYSFAVVPPVGGSTIFAGAIAGSVFRSTDGGDHWTSVLTVPTTFSITLAAIGETLFVGTEGGIYRTTDYGSNWDHFSLPRNVIRSLAVIGSSLFAAAEPGGTGIYLSTDYGATWSTQNNYFPNVLTLAVIGQVLFAGRHEEGVYFSTDYGVNWTATNAGLPIQNNDVRALATSGLNVISGLYYNYSPGGRALPKLGASPLSKWVIGVPHSGIWDRSISEMIFDTVSASSGAHGTIIPAGPVSTGYGLTDTFAVASEPGYHIAALIVDGVNQGARSSFVLSSVTAKHTIKAEFIGDLLPAQPGWNMLSLPVIPIDSHKSSLFPDAISNAFTYTGAYTISPVLADGPGYWLKFASQTPIALTGRTVDAESVSVKARWNMIGSISSPVGVSSITSNPPGIATSSFYTYSGHYVISDTIMPGRAYWVKSGQDGKLFLSHSSLAQKAAARIHVVPDNEFPPPPPETESIPRRYPAIFSLDQNFPNPFNPQTEVRYQIPEPSFVSLKIYDIMGREVRTLVNERMEAGYYTENFDGEGLSSGVYICHMRASATGQPAIQFSQTRKMILTK